MTSGYDQPARSASTSSPHPNPGRPRGRHMVTLLAAPPAVAHARPSQPLAAELLTASVLPATTAGPTAVGPKLPPFTGD